MSLESWKAKYYSVKAGDVPKMQAAQHSLQKWEGLLPEVLAEHGLMLDGGELYYEGIAGRELFEIDGSTCALCQVSGFSCISCALFDVRGGRCDRVIADEEVSPYKKFIFDCDPKPMIIWLQRAVELEKERSA